MRVRLAPQIAAKVEGARVEFKYPNLSTTANLLLDAITRNWDLKLGDTASPPVDETRIQLDARHIDWLTEYGTERGLNTAAATNLVISDYFRNGLQGTATIINPEKPEKELSVQKMVEVVPQQEETKQITSEPPQEKPRGSELMKGLKL